MAFSYAMLERTVIAIFLTIKKRGGWNTLCGEDSYINRGTRRIGTLKEVGVGSPIIYYGNVCWKERVKNTRKSYLTQFIRR